MTSELESILEFARNIAEQAGDLVVGLRSQHKLDVQFKQGIELVTNADIESETLITNAIKAQYPDHQILAEESNPDLSSVSVSDAPLWIIDPIDGTVNYAHHHHQVAISIAYAVRGQVQVAVVYSPFQAEMFCAIRDQGAWMNDQPISCSPIDDLSKAIVATGFPYDKSTQLPQLINRLHKVLEQAADVRRLGSAALDMCWVALGRLDAYYETVSPWDSAAAFLIAKESGAKCGHFLPKKTNAPDDLYSQDILVAAPKLYEPLKNILIEAQLDSDAINS